MSLRQRRAEQVSTCEKGKAGHNLIGKRDHQAVCRAGLKRTCKSSAMKLASNCRGEAVLMKRTFTDVIFDCRISQIQAQEDTAIGTSTGVIYIPCLMVWCIYFTTWANELLILVQGNARARRWDKRVRATHVFLFP